jgi:hypothetical protein
MAVKKPAPMTERQRVDMELEQKKAARRKTTKASPAKKYPVAIRAMGQGFRNLYDTLGDR